MNLNEEQLNRYNRNIKIKGFEEEGQVKLLRSSVFVIGAGGLGSPVLSYLAAAGVGRIGIADSDVAYPSNLNRQILHSMKTLEVEKVKNAKRFIEDLNPDVSVETYYLRVTIDNIIGLISDYDCVVDCTDTLLLKFLINDACVEARKPLIHAGVVAMNGQMLPVRPGITACLRCLFPETPSCSTGPHSIDVGILGSCAGIMGALQATEAIKLLVGLENSFNRLTIYDGFSTSFKTLEIERNEECPVCSKMRMLPAKEYQMTRVCSD